MVKGIVRTKRHSFRAGSSLAILLILVFAGTFSVSAAFGAYSSGLASPQTGIAHPTATLQNPIVAGRQSPKETCEPSGLCPTMVDGAYNFTALHNSGVVGKGQTVVIVDACGNPDIVNDVNTFDSTYSLPKIVLNVLYPQGKNVCVDSGWSLETSLDVEWAHVVAPNATIDLLVASQPQDSPLFGSWTYALSNHLGNQISNSWIDYDGGACPASVAKILNNASAEHVTVLAASGDGGGGYGNSYPQDCLHVLSVGGTTLSVTTAGKYESESAWSGTGGGYVSGTHEAGYQTRVNITDSAHELAKADVSAVADPSTGVWVYNTPYCGGWCVVGGTSVACPLWAAFLADANQIRASNGYAAAGFVTRFLYKTVYGLNGGSSVYGKDFHDVTTGSNGYSAGKGWDVPTGLGTFIANTLANEIGSNSGA
jgi:subtilase family serine protease